MKKIFRMALVFALAGATLMYTGCTKDYSEDINKLDSEISSLENEYKALSDELASLKSGVASLEAAYKAADSALENKLAGQIADIEKNLNGKIAEIEKAIDKKADKADVEAQIKALKDEALKLAEDLQKKLDEFKGEVNDKLAEAQKKLDEATAAFSNELRSLVFVPDFYVDGIEASSYYWADIYPYESYWADKNNLGQKIDRVTETDKGVKVIFPVGAKILWRYIEERNAQDKPVLYNEQGKVDPNGEIHNYYKDYTLGQNGKLSFDLNPSSFAVEDAEWSLKGMNRPFITRADETAWTPEFIGVEKIDGEAVIEYAIANPEYLFCTTGDEYSDITEFNYNMKRYEAKKIAWDPAEYNNIPVIQAKATLEDGKDISSDWEAIANGYEFFDHLAFALDNDYEAKGTDCAISGVKDLYTDALETIAAGDVVPVQYNGGPVDLAKLISIHEYINYVGANEITLAELNAKYPGFKYEFELLPFTLGENKTSENMYGTLTKDGIFTPCYVKSENGKAESVVIAKGSEDKLGISSVGRTPVVLVTLVEPKGDVILYAYFKLQIVKNVDQREVNIPSFGKLPYICGSTPAQKTSWADFSYLVLEKLGLDYAQFAAQYTDTEIWANEMVATDPTKPWVKEEKFIKIADVTKSGDVYSATTDYGVTTYTVDKQGNTVNDALTWEVIPTKIGAGKTKTLYHKFVNNIDANDVVYVTLTATVADAAKFDFGKNKMANEWFDDIHVWAIDDAEANTAHMNTLVAEANNTEANPVYSDAKGGNVLNYTRDLNHYYQSYVPGVALAADADAIYASAIKSNDYKAKLQTAAEYSFASEQPVINGVPLFTNEYETYDTCAVNKVLYAAAYNSNGKVKTHNVTVNFQTIAVPTIEEDNIIAIISGNKVKYMPTETAKEFLNYWGHKETAEDKILYANIHVDVTYGDCKIESGEADFHLRFIRPLDINLEEQKISKDGVVDGANVYLAQFLSDIVDWNGVKVIKVNVDTTTNVKSFEPNVVSNIDMFKFYQFTGIKVDISKAKINGWGSDPKEYAYAYDQFKADGSLKTAGKKPDMKLSIGWINKGQFEQSSLYNATTKVFDYDLTASGHSVEAFNTYVINYRNDAARLTAFDIQIPISFEYAWGSYEGILEINVEGTN